MREMCGDLWTLAEQAGGWAIVPTNGCVRPNGELVMGAGVAQVAAGRHPGLAAILGAHVSTWGNTPAIVPAARVISWPTKPAVHFLDGGEHPGWMCAAKVKRDECVRQVARLVWAGAAGVPQLVTEAGLAGPFFLPRLGCGLGGLDWAQVGPALTGVLDDRFIAVSL